MATVMGDLTAAWSAEPEPKSEATWTEWGAGWHAWNRWSPEVEFAEWVAMFVRLQRPALVVETGVGQGFTTRRVLEALPDGAHFIGYESDAGLAAELVHLDPGFDVGVGSPPSHVLERADLTILDSAADRRHREIEEWAELAHQGAYCIVHDVSTRHAFGSNHRALATTILRIEERDDIAGVLLPNPRGAWLGTRR